MTPLYKTAINVFDLEISALKIAKDRLSKEFPELIEILSKKSGRVIVTGVGKSGLIGKKIAATFASTGTSSFFLHPTEALHGDLGMVRPEDSILALSNSGETSELLKILPFFKENNNLLISITGNVESSLGLQSDFVLDSYVEEEACPLNLAPTCSTTVSLVLGDVLAVALMKAREFTEKDFARFHPGGSLGRRLLHKVEDEMVFENLPVAGLSANGEDIVNLISSGRLGLCCIANDKGAVVGLVTDGDLRRSIQTYKSDFFTVNVSEIMSSDPSMISADCMVSDAWQLMDDKNITSLLVVDEQKKLRGILKK